METHSRFEEASYAKEKTEKFENIEYIVETEESSTTPPHQLKRHESRIINQIECTNSKNSSTNKDSPQEPQIKKRRPRTVYETGRVSKNKIGVNIALPHFLVTDSTFEETIVNKAYENDPDGENEMTEIQSKKIKTLTPSVFIPPDLNDINDFCLSPSEADGDGHSIYKCNHCPKAFAAPYHLMVHMRKSHMCQYCWSTFEKTTDLHDHVKETHKTFNCLICAKEFQSNGNLRQHLRKNHSVLLPAHISLLNVSEVHVQ